MHAPAPVAVPTEIRALDVGPRLDRVWRLTQSIGEEGMLFSRALPWEPRRPVKLSFRLPDDEVDIEVTGVVEEVRPEREPEQQEEDDQPAARGVRFSALDEETRERIRGYVLERTFLP